MIKLKSWEYWPFGILQFPLFIYWLWLSARSRSLLFFSASNPGIPMGGMFGESKFDVIVKIPKKYIPKTIRIDIPTTKQVVIDHLQKNGFSLPVIFKPDLGERGYMVKRIVNESDIDQYIQRIKVSFLVQELVDLPHEFGVFYTRLPNQPKGKVTSVVMKEMLTVTGDGKATFQELILKKDRAKLQWDKLKVIHRERLREVIPANETIEIVSIGNHALGTKFLNGSHLINEKLSAVFDEISRQIDGFFFGRFDIRCASLDDLYQGRIKILELNGCGAEPAHIYDPDYSMSNAIKDLIKHWRNIFLISRENHKRGVPYTSFREGLNLYRKFKDATR
jgi:hypothetical protein